MGTRRGPKKTTWQPSRRDRVVAENIRKFRLARDLTQEELGMKLGATQAYIGHIENLRKGVGMHSLFKLSNALNMPFEAFLEDEAEVTPPKNPEGRIPRLTWKQAANWQKIQKKGATGGDIRWLSFDIEDPQAFALVMDGDSMEPEFSEGDTLIVSPSYEPTNGDFIISKINDSVMLRQFKFVDNMTMLIPLNSRYQPMAFMGDDVAPLTVMGKVVAVIKRY